MCLTHSQLGKCSFKTAFVKVDVFCSTDSKITTNMFKCLRLEKRWPTAVLVSK